MKILLLRPYFNFIFSQPNPPLGLGYLASCLEKAGHKVIILDLPIWRIPNNKINTYVERIRPDIIGITALTAYYGGMKELCHEIQDIPTVLGGVHVSSLPIISFKECDPDFVIYGEGEVTFVELVEAIEAGKTNYDGIKGLHYKEGDRIKQTPSRSPIQNLDDIPFPAWHLMKPKWYPPDPHGLIMKNYPYAPVLSTRGCPFSCTYCSSTNFWGNNFRRRSPKNVVDEIEFLIKEYNIREIHFWDDNFTLIKKHIIGICKEILERKLNISMSCPNGVRVDSLDKSILNLMKKAGFYSITLAIESGSQKILTNVKKNLELKNVQKAAILAKKMGFYLPAFFILGLPGETKETIKETIEISRRLPIDRPGFFIATPLPGSEDFKKWASNRQLENFDWNSTHFYKISQNNVENLEIINLNSEDLLKYQKEAYKLFYFRLKTLFKTILNLSKYLKPRQIKPILQRVRYAAFGV